MSDQTFVEWVPYKLTLRPAKDAAPGGGSWAQLDAYARHLADLLLPDPTKASALRVAAERVRDVAAASNKPIDVEDLDERVAAGELSAQDALRMLSKRADPEEARKQQRKRQDDADTLTRQLLHKAVLAVHSYGDEWLAMLRPLAADAVKKRDQAMWQRTHDFARWLRDPTVGVCALSAAMGNPVQDSDWFLYAVGDGGRGLHLWRVEHCGPGQAIPGVALPLPGGGWRVAHSLKPNAPLPIIADFAENAEAWGGVGLYTAEQMIENLNLALAEQDRELDQLVPPEPSPSKRRALMI